MKIDKQEVERDSHEYNATALGKSIREFEEHILINKRQAQNTVVSYLQNIREFAAYIASGEGGKLENWGQINQLVAEAYLAHCRDEGKAQRSINLRITTLRMFFDFLVLRREANNNPFYAVKHLKPIATQPPVLTIRDINRLVSAPRCLWMEVLENNPPNNQTLLDFGEYKAARDEAIIRLLFFAGLKTGEVVSLCDKHFDNRTALLNVSSARTSRTIFLVQTVATAIVKAIRLKNLLFSGTQALFANKHGQALSARSIERLVKEYAVYYGVRADITPQDLRNSFENRLILAGADSNMIQYLLGHADASTTETLINQMRTALQKANKAGKMFADARNR